MNEPFLKAFLFCQEARPRPDGTLDVVGLWQQLAARTFPGRYQVGIFIAWANLQKPRYDMQIRVEVPLAPEPFVVDLPLETQGRGRFDWMNMAVLDLEIAQPGDILFQVLLDGRLYGTCTLPVLSVEGP